MLNRRQLMTGAAFGGAAVTIGTVIGSRAAAALTIEPMTAPVKAAFALACKTPAASVGDHVAMIADAQTLLKQEIASGAAKADTVEVVVCPICGCRFTVTADASF
ncbi:MAG TPA: hypothetical protein VLA85_08385 [Verrucomicrobiae bacterium]|nr:hypothetical protein [Verrucomicrobiae bacterium]